MNLKYEDCLNFFNTYASWEDRFDADFGDHDMISITYEEFQADKSRFLEKIQQFLDVPLSTGLQTSLKKQRRQTLHEAIANYDELKSRFNGSKWEIFFKD